MYYRDLDGDGFGDPGDTQSGASPGAGWVKDNNDCDDTDASVNPAGVDSPDATSSDTNCDGLDGDISRAIFVDSAGGSDSFAGTPRAPMQTIGAKGVFCQPGVPKLSRNLISNIEFVERQREREPLREREREISARVPQLKTLSQALRKSARGNLEDLEVSTVRGQR